MQSTHFDESSARYFVIGSSEVGKSTFAQKLGDKFNLPTVSAGGWVRDYFHSCAQREDMITYSQERLRENPQSAIDYVIANIDGPYIIEGVRNPRDFSALFDYRKDVAIYLKPAESLRAEFSNDFDEGVDIIVNQLKWYVKNNLLDEERFQQHIFTQITQLESIVEDNYGH